MKNGEGGKRTGVTCRTNEVLTRRTVTLPYPRTSVSLSFAHAFPKLILRLLDYVVILRPLLLIPAWTMLFLGYYKGIEGRFAADHSLPLIGNMPVVWRPDSRILITLVLYSLLMGAVYILNQISDRRTDEINGKLYLVARGYVQVSRLKIQIGVLFSLSIIMAFLLEFSRPFIYLILLSIVLGVLYSVPPIRLKGRPILDLLANAFGFGVVAFAVGWISRSSFSTDLILKCLPYFICISSAFINTTIPDMRGDVQNGDITTGVLLGIRNSCIVSTFLLSLVPPISLILGDYICLTASIVSLPFFVYMTISNWDERSPRISAVTLATKVSLLILSVVIAIFIPFYIILLVLTFLLVKVYYRMRFGISYP